MESYSICLCLTLFIKCILYSSMLPYIYESLVILICMYMLYYLYLLMSVLPNINKASIVGTGYLFESLMPILENYNKNYDSCIT